MLRYFAYNTLFNKPFAMAGKTFTRRYGVILAFSDGKHTAFGEVAPLPGFSPEKLKQVLQVLLTNKVHLEQALINGTTEAFNNILHSIHNFSSLSFGLDTLLADLNAQRAGKTLQTYLWGDKFQPPNVNAVVGLGADALKQATTAVEKSVYTLKIKVGADQELELNQISKIRNAFPDIKIRLDANQAWSTDEALHNLNLFAPFHIEYCEQPVSAGDIHSLKKVTDESPIPIAADEAVRSVDEARSLINQDACDLLILKPALFGRFDDLIVTKRLAASHSIEAVITTSFDSIIGRTATAVLASGLGSKKHAHGLATGVALNEPFIRHEIHRGTYNLPETPGLGIPLDLSRYKEIN